MTKTNVMRLLDAAAIPYEAVAYDVDEDDLSGERTARVLGVPPESVFKTLALAGERTGVFICCVPCHEEIDLRKAARAAGDKKAQMLPQKSLLAATGYVRGGCSPIGMRRAYPIFIDETCALLETIFISAGARGAMVRLSTEALIAYTGAACADLTIA